MLNVTIAWHSFTDIKQMKWDPIIRVWCQHFKSRWHSGLLASAIRPQRFGGGRWIQLACPCWFANERLLNFFLGGVWGRHCRARWYTQPGWGVEAQLHNLHCIQVLVLPHLVCYLRYPCCSALGLPVCLHLLLPHLGCGSLHQKLPDRVAVYQPHLLSLHSDLLWSPLRGPGQDLQQCASGTAQRSLRTHILVFMISLD